MSRYFVAGGAGFIGSHMVRQATRKAAGTCCGLRQFQLRPGMAPAGRLPIDGRAGRPERPRALTEAIAGSDAVFHFASNPDIAKAATQPDIDFWEGTYLTQNLLEAMRIAGVPRLIYASGSGVYGDTGDTAVTENYSPLLPISTYGASKLACEVLICSYTHMFDLLGVGFRFANVVGPRQTHGVAYDFIRRLLKDPTRLEILGDGQQSKSYIHVEDVVDALLLLHDRGWTGFDVFNVATEDYVTVRQIADLVAGRLGISASTTNTPADAAAGKGTCRSSGSTHPSSAASVGPTDGPRSRL